jgi:replicative DNA helicase
MTANLAELAREYVAAGISILPIKPDGSKAPEAKFLPLGADGKPTWAPFQSQIADPETISRWYGNGSRLGIAAIGGLVSGGLEILDLDCAEVFGPWGELVKAAGGSELLARLVIVRTPNGWHAYFRSATPEGNMKLARRPGEPRALIEKKGEGGYCLLPGCPRECHATGREYILKQGSLSQIPTLTVEERRLLLDCARAFDEMPPMADREAPGKPTAAGGRPGDDFAAATTWPEILEPAGWKRIYLRGDTDYWRRPGKSYGISATTNHHGSELLFVFSTSTGFESERGYSKFSAYAFLNHNGDFQAAARELAARGFGKPREEKPPIFEEEPPPDFECGTPEQNEPPAWTEPAPFYASDLPVFPTHTLPAWLREFVEAEATATQTPADLPAMVSLAVVAASTAKKFVVEIRRGFIEPLNIYAIVSLPVANRKSQVHRDTAEPIERWEAKEARAAAPEIARAAAKLKILERVILRKQETAAKCDDPGRRGELAEEAAILAGELAEQKPPVTPRLLADDATPERLQTLLRDHGGRMAILSAEGDLFDLIAGRYSPNGAPNLAVYLKGHSGDTLRVDRTGRPPEFIKEPALTIGLTVQPETIRGLAAKPGFRGRGLLARILYSLPNSILGRRKIDAPPVPEEIRAQYHEKIGALLSIRLRVDEDGNAVPRHLTLDDSARASFSTFMAWLEPQLAPLGELGFIADWAGKLAGAVARIAGLMHLAEHAGEREPWTCPISDQTLDAAIQIGEYLIPHARAAFAEMGTDPVIEAARDILEWITKAGRLEFTKRELFNARRGRFKRAKELDEPLELLAEHGYIREKITPGNPKGGRPSQSFEVNPATHNRGIA